MARGRVQLHIVDLSIYVRDHNDSTTATTTAHSWCPAVVDLLFFPSSPHPLIPLPSLRPASEESGQKTDRIVSIHTIIAFKINYDFKVLLMWCVHSQSANIKAKRMTLLSNWPSTLSPLSDFWLRFHLVEPMYTTCRHELACIVLLPQGDIPVTQLHLSSHGSSVSALLPLHSTTRPTLISAVSDCMSTNPILECGLDYRAWGQSILNEVMCCYKPAGFWITECYSLTHNYVTSLPTPLLC